MFFTEAYHKNLCLSIALGFGKGFRLSQQIYCQAYLKVKATFLKSSLQEKDKF